MAVTMPNGPLQIVFSFDTTGSMSAALTEVRGRLSDMLQRLQADLPQVTTAVVAHGDYCDRNKPYITKHIDFTNDLNQLVSFVNNVETTYGGDEPEAYEVMLRLVRKDLSWVPATQRVLVVIGDAFPHEADDFQNKDKVDWREETRLLQHMGVRIYGVQVNDSEKSTQFFQTMTEVTDGQHLKLSQFGTLCDVIMAICYREKGAEFLSNYEAEVRAREGRQALHRDLEGVFGVLRRADSSASAAAASPAVSRPDPAPKTGRTSKVKAGRTSKVKAGRTSKVKAGRTSKVKAATKTSIAKKLVARAAGLSAVKARGKAGFRPRKLTATRLTARKAPSSCTLLRREKVPDTNFRFNRLRWSPWKLAVVPVDAEVTSGSWRRCLRGSARAKSGVVAGVAGLGEGQGRGSVMYEMAVQTRSGARRHVVWCRVLSASSANRLSLSRLLAAPSVRAQLQRVMGAGCRVWLRGAKVNRGHHAGVKVRDEVRTVYDYAWCGNQKYCRDLWVPNGLPSHRVQIAGALA